MKKIAYITPMIAPYRVSFFEKLVNQTKDELEWMFFSGIKNKDDGRPAYKGEVGIPNSTYVLSERKIGPWTLAYSEDLLKKIIEFNPDIITMYGNAGAIVNWKIANWAKKNGKKIILWVCSWDSGRSKSLFKDIKRMLTKFYYSKADFFICYSSHAELFLTNLGFPRKMINIAYNGLDIDDVVSNKESIISNGAKLREENQIQKNEKLFLYVGGLIKEKKIIELIRAFKKLNFKYNNTKLWIIGDGPLRNQVKESIKDCENIKYWGRITDGVDDYFAACDWFVLPGCGGLALNQAMLLGKPCICDRADGTEMDLIFDGISGYRFDSEDVNNLEFTMKKALNTQANMYEQMSDISFKLIIRRSNVDNMVNVYLDSVRKFI